MAAHQWLSWWGSGYCIVTLVTLGRLTDVSLNKNGGSREAVKNKGSVWVEGERIRSPFLTRRKMTQKPNHSRNEFSLHLFFRDIWDSKSSDWGLLKTVGRLTEQEPSGDWGLLVKWNLVAIPTFSLIVTFITFCKKKYFIKPLWINCGI